MEEIKNEQIASEKVLDRSGTLVNSRGQVISIVQFIALLSVAIFAPALGVQIITGTLVNAALFISAALLGVPAAIMIGIIPSVVSSVTGLLPAAILPMVPFIIFSNAILVLIFAKLYKKSYWKGVVAASFVKFAFLSVVSSFVIGYFVSAKVASNISIMMSYPQLLTALSGGILAYAFLGVIKKTGKK
ncbi:MAG: iron hydrogenase [Candidatus Paceibacterota bacterium]|jgi:hypothetical protein